MVEVDRASRKCSPFVSRAAVEWSWPGSNRRHPACKAGALPTELQPQVPEGSTPPAFAVSVRPEISGKYVICFSVVVVGTADSEFHHAGFEPATLPSNGHALPG